MMKTTKEESKDAIRQLATQWAGETGVKVGQAAQPSFQAFVSWVHLKGFGSYLEFPSTAGSLNEVEHWFDAELGQSWRN